MKGKKGAELSVNVIIIAVIALLVLVVLFALFTGRLSIFNIGVASCEGKGGTCIPETIGCGEQKYSFPGTNCLKAKTGVVGELCCIPLQK
ncbi:MAG: hypothetical protein NTV63_03335 [Candidatus Woesearchaeota archaeon]|nr:hypothetical protein [Candidatus Woesearchaeota archaeon]